MCEQHKPQKSKYRSTQWWKWLTWFLSVLLLDTLALTACDAGPTPDPTPHTVVVTPPPSVLHRPMLLIQISPDVTGSYPRSLMLAFVQQMADWLDGLPRVNSDGATVYVTLVNSEPYSPTSTVLSFTSGSVSNWPSWDGPTPTPACPDNPYSCSDAQASVAAANAAASAKYQKQLEQVQAQLADRQQAMKLQTQKLRILQPQSDNRATSIWGVLNLASQRFKGASGEKWLILATDLANNEEIDHIPPDLTGTHVLVLDLFCSSAVACKRTSDIWGQVFKNAHAADWRFLDPGQSRNLQSPWS